MKTYDTYKDSGIEWIGQIPEHWDFVKLKYVTNKIIDGAHFTPTYVSEGIPFLRVTDIQDKEVKLSDVKRIPQEEHLDLIKRCNPEKGDVLLSKNGTIGITKVIDWDWEFSIFVSLCLIKFKGILSPEFFTFFFNSSVVETQIKQNSKTTSVTNLHLDKIKELIMPKIPKTEQTAIANYLDHKTAEIDQLIADKKRLVALYQEEKTAIINQAVTKGITPDAKRKDSGIEWLGAIPEHWEVKKLRYLSKITTGNKDTENREEDAEYPFFVRSQTIEKISTFSFDGEAILTAGDGVGVCKVWHYINGKFDFHQRVYMIYDFEEVSGKLLFQFLKHNFIHEVLKKSAKSTVDSLRRPMFLDFPVAYSKDKTEQTAIVQHIEKESARIDAKINQAERYIKLLTEYRTALISEVVTGKVKVIES